MKPQTDFLKQEIQKNKESLAIFKQADVPGSIFPAKAWIKYIQDQLEVQEAILAKRLGNNGEDAQPEDVDTELG